MTISPARRREDFFRKLRRLAFGPQMLAFLPAIMLGAFWFGGEGFLFVIAVTMPTLLALTGTFEWPWSKGGGRDALTGLPGRSDLVDRLSRGMTEGANDRGDPSVCLVVDIDNVPSILSQFGDAGLELVLRTCADRIAFALREGDLLAALAPGRFGLALAKTPRTDLEAMIQLAGRLQDRLEQPISLDGTRVLLSACIGFALPSRLPDQTGESCLDAAESALAEAQEAGPGSVRAFSRGMRPRVSVPDNMTREVVAALETGQIVPWFQPQISTNDGALSGLEALARWEHPEKGQIAPAAFLPAIASAGLFERLGEVMLFQSLTALKEWDRRGLIVPNVAVNVSADELRNPRLFEKIRWELDRFDLKPERLVIEILENVVAQSEDDTTTRNIAALSRLGCGIDLDDFGTGHASISNIRRFDVTRIKIDRSFISHVDTDRDQQNMVSAILTMAERLGLDSLGEGVETHGEHAMLAQLGCNHVQGYSIARPMPFSATLDWIAAHHEKVPRPPRIGRSADDRGQALG
ncbi:bifunctional diguanylate cyclase/phosphodiesterase [Maritimibacter sp. DP1N21-5]|uniref:putative bifunctional diguanylate cyclase/phosphodiesterase n=1 Tax=Maritimibacter sp. DP1N21-5 TaxID=2836867 RepID=UPI001C466D1B|nr:bifunctional diguanylate cyclase/phosphodiesterase [Maritimibacter sp. DP1N21-5]MBV7408155.1 bifunctional diguanylate cyclase/phosphodiesterase [Maritimibacter sp. DP1N21-5]